MITIQRLRIRNYRGISALDFDASNTAGAIARGRNGSGKTSALRAIGAALASSDIGPDAVRIGEDDGEILVDLAVADRKLTVRRRFAGSGKKSDVSIDDEHGSSVRRPAEVLGELLGTSPLDVVGVVLDSEDEP